MPALRVFWNHRLRSQWPCEVATPPRNHLNCGIVGTLTRRALREDETTMEDRSSRRRANPGDKARRGLSANEIACALISMMARSTCSNQRPNTLMQDRISQRRPKPLAPHGRTIHKGQSRHFDRCPATSGLPPETDILTPGRHVSNVPTAEATRTGEHWRGRQTAIAIN